MSEDSKPPETPSSASGPAPDSTPAQPTGTTPAQPVSTPSTAPMGSRPPGPSAVSPSNPPIDILMPTPKKPFTIPPYAGCFVKMIFGFTVLLVMGYCALVALNPKAQQWATQGGKDGSGGPTPFKAMNQILAIPAQAIGKTKDVVAKSDARVGVLDNVIATDDKQAVARKEAKPITDPFGSSTSAAPGQSAARAAGAAEDNAGGDLEGKISREALLAKAARDTAEADAKPKPAAARPVAVAPPPPPGPPELKLPGGIVLTNSSPAGAPPASAPFMYWVAGLSISGVSNSTPARFLMNNKLVREGDEVNKQLSITFDHLDGAAKLIYFRDKDGAIVTRSY
jgi:hypothetical protein